MLRALGRFVFGRLLPRRPYRVWCGPLRGARFVLGALAGDGAGASVYFNLIEPGQSRTLVRLLKEGDVFFDIGANVGYYSILGARRVGAQGRVVAIEPSTRNISFLRRHVQLNRTDHVQIVPAACSDQIGMRWLTPGRNHATGYLAERSEMAGARDGYLVSTVTVDELAGQPGLLPRVIKIDVEGSELDVLKGARRTLREARPAILLSTHSPELRSACLAYLQSADYTCEALDRADGDSSEFLARPLR